MMNSSSIRPVDSGDAAWREIGDEFRDANTTESLVA